MLYLIIIVVVLLASPLILILASNQKKEVKKILQKILLVILCTQIFFGFFNWENFSLGRSGIELSLTYTSSFLVLFFLITIIQITLLLINKSLNILVVVLNFINTILIFVGMVRLSSILGFQAVSFASIGTTFLVLLGNVTSLAFINKDKNLLRKYLR